MRVLGVDGCRGGWLAALDTGRGDLQWRWSAAFAPLLALDVEAVAVDIPIGLPERGRRACDEQARALLGPRRSSVFPAPVRAVLSCATYAEARALLARRGGASMSAQAWGIVAAVRDVDAALHVTDEQRVVEAHPELALRRLAGAELPPKRSPDGHRRRVAALTSVWSQAAELVAAASGVDAPRPPAPDDAVDAMACAWVARQWRRGDAVVVGDGTRDARGLLMRIAS